jgi:uncharacterized membrane protein
MITEHAPSRRALLAGALAVPAAAALSAVPAAAARASAADWEAALAAYEGALAAGDGDCASLAPGACLVDRRSHEEQWAPYFAARRAQTERKAMTLRTLMLTPAPDFEALVVKQSLAFSEYSVRQDAELRRALAADLARLSRAA